MAYHIFTGRFQPFHNGHLEIVNKAISELSLDDTLVIAVITAFKGEVIDNDFANKAAEHHESERNPWLTTVPLKAISNLVSDFELANKIIYTILPCPDTSWTEISKWFPRDRKWIVPNAGEAFDEEKVKFYIGQGEDVIRYTETSNISGRELRNCFFNLDYENFCKYIPPKMADIYWNGGRR